MVTFPTGFGWVGWLQVDDNDHRKVIRPKGDEEGILDKHKAGDTSDLVAMSNKPPRWNEQMQAYCLNFHGRVTQASVKNFQLVRGCLSPPPPPHPCACVPSAPPWSTGPALGMRSVRLLCVGEVSPALGLGGPFQYRCLD